MRVACYGFVNADAGSVAGANHLIIEHLLQREHTIDFFAKKDFVYPASLFAYDGFTYIGIERDGYQRIERWAHATPISTRALRFAVGQVSYHAHLQLIQREILRRHADMPYDVALFLGTGAPFAVPAHDLLVVTWVQGPPLTEIEAIKRHQAQIRERCGWLTYAKLRAYYLWRDGSSKRENRRADQIICGSEWSRSRIVETGVPADTVHALPYPFDLEFFEARPRQTPTPPTFGWLGRIVPRKRLDLLVSAFELVVQKHPEAHLDIVGHFDSFQGFRSLLDECNVPEGRISYRERIPRSEVPAYLRSVTALVQPSENENFGSSVAEAMAVGTPAIVGPTNGTSEYAVGGCYHFAEHTPDALAHSMIQCLEHQQRDAEAVALEARAAACDMFAPGLVVEKLETILQQAAGAPTRSEPASESVSSLNLETIS
jgi:glycosyltransferase involved in cell wall biosynthesis